MKGYLAFGLMFYLGINDMTGWIIGILATFVLGSFLWQLLNDDEEIKSVLTFIHDVLSGESTSGVDVAVAVCLLTLNNGIVE
jgi:hypothetical protein